MSATPDGADGPKKHTNRLANETSPYLLQHAHNPVDWYPWGDEAFAKAKAENKPVFLSIGYSTCHWCHVMERESFEDEAIGQYLREHFVCIKVDREERPDVDQIYMKFTQAFIRGGGGWPMSVWLTAERKPFYAGTYFPPEDRFGRPGFRTVCNQVLELWTKRRADIDRITTEEVPKLFQDLARPTAAKLTPEPLESTAGLLKNAFDQQHGGFGNRPKFPTPHQLLFLMRQHYRTGEKRLLDITVHSLDGMAAGGIHDHVGGGFHRYSTDREWLVPHFEKMLYDQAGLLQAYAEAFQLTGHQRFAHVARGIVAYVLRDLRDPAGAFYSAEDADSEGEEGKFYVWTVDELVAVLGKETGERFAGYYGAKATGNWHDEATGQPLPSNILHLPLTADALDRARADDLTHARARLLEVRAKRIRPLRDDKILTAWNGLFISALARAGRALEEPSWITAAAEAADFLLTTHRRKDGRLLRSSRLGQVKQTLGYIDDYAFLANGLLDLYESTGDARWLAESATLYRQMLELFGRDGGGLLYFTGLDAEQLITRPTETFDGAVPAGNSVAAYAGARLGRLLAEAGLTGAATAILEHMHAQLADQGANYTYLLLALDATVNPAREIVLSGTPGDGGFEGLRSVVALKFLPEAVIAVHPAGDAGDRARGLMEFLAAQTPVDGKAAAYVCENYACRAPVTSPRELADLLAAKPGAGSD